MATITFDLVPGRYTRLKHLNSTAPHRRPLPERIYRPAFERSVSASSALGLLNGRKRSLDAPSLLLSDETEKHLPEMGMLGARVDILPPIGFQE